MTPPTDGALYLGQVVHRRARPKRHCLRYEVFSLLVDLDRLPELDRRLRLLSLNRFNLFSIAEKDFGRHDGSPIGHFIREKAAAGGIDGITRITMLCYPRLLGFAFNPITVYYLHGEGDALVGLVYEVRNTFGQNHLYQAKLCDSPSETVRHELPKAFYVSPFNTLDGTYRFTIRPPGDSVFTGVTLADAEGAIVAAYFEGRREALTDHTLLRLAFAYPLMTMKVVAGIYWEALRLYLKGVPLTLHLRPR